MSSQAERTEQATPRRLQQAREKGDFATSKELVAAAQFFTFVIALSVWGGDWFDALKYSAAAVMQSAFRSEITVQRLTHIAVFLARESLAPMLGAGALVLSVAVGVHLAVTGGGFSTKKFSSGLSNFSPLNRFQEIQKQAFGAILQGAVLLAGSGFALYWVAQRNAGKLYSLPFMSAASAASAAFGSIDDLLWKASGIFLVFGAWELFRQKRKFLERMKMTKQEIREEAKESEGNPHIKSKIRRLQRDMSRRRMMSEVPKATVVLVNPTHYAVALRYDHESMPCPLVVAKGKNYLALRIRKLAVDHGVPLVENPPLARALYASAEVGQEIPPALYRAIAEVLAFVYQLANRGAGRPQ